jgi:hypothetical protein
MWVLYNRVRGRENGIYISDGSITTLWLPFAVQFSYYISGPMILGKEAITALSFWEQIWEIEALYWSPRKYFIVLWLEWKRAFGGPKLNLEDITKIYLSADLFGLSQDMYKWWAFVDTAMDFLVLWQAWDFGTSWGTISSSSTLCCGVSRVRRKRDLL